MSSSTEAPLPLNGLLNIQKTYLNDLAQLSSQNKNVAGDLNDIQTRLEQIHKSFKQANTSAEQTLTHQSKVEDILDKEHDRLMSKKEEIDNIHYGKMRSVELNDSYRKRQSEYIHIIVVIIIAILLYIACYMFLPQPALDIFVVIIVTFVIIYCGNILWEMYKRDNMNHDRLDLAPPEEVSSPTRGIATITPSGTEASAGPLCTGEVCCAEGSRWDATMNKCIIACPNPAKPLSKGGVCVESASCVAPDFKLCGNACVSSTETCGIPAVSTFSTLGEERVQTKTTEVKPYTPYEYSTYSPVM